MKVGKVESLALEDGAVLVEFRVDDVFVGDRTEAAIKIETVLGAKYVALVPRGSGELDPDEPIPLERTASPYDVVEAFADLSSTIDDIDTAQLASSFEVMAETFADTPDEVRTSLEGLARLSDTISSRDAQLGQLLSATRQVTQVLADRNGEFQQLIIDSNTLLTEVQERRELIDSILTSTQRAVRAAVGPGRGQPRGAHPGPAAAQHRHRHPVPQPRGAGPDGEQPRAVRPGVHQHPGQRPLVRQLRQRPAPDDPRVGGLHRRRSVATAGVVFGGDG